MTDKLLDQYLELRALLYNERSDDVTIVVESRGKASHEQHIHITSGSVTCLEEVLQEFPSTILHSTDSRLCVWRYDQ